MTSPVIRLGPTVAQFVRSQRDLQKLNARDASQAAGLDTLWSDTFKDNTGIDAGNSSGYTYRGTPNFDVIKDASDQAAHEAMTAASSPSPLVASDSHHVGSQAAWMIFDFANANYWQSNAGTPQSAKIDLGSSKTVATYKMEGYDGSNYPTAWTLEGSNNDADWTELDAVTGHATATLTEFTIDTPAAYRYYRITITAMSAGDILVRSVRLYLADIAEADIRSVRALDLASAVNQVIPFFEVTLNSGTATYYVSSDDGATWTEVTQEQLDNFQMVSVPAGTQFKLRCVLTGDAELEFWGIAA